MRTFVSLSEASSEAGDSEKSCESTPTGIVMYEKGAIFTLRAGDLDNRLLTVRVLRVYRPFSFSSVMTVEILHGLARPDDIPRRAVLKLFDRRFAHDLRAEHRLDPWTSAHEDAFIDFIRSGRAADFMASLHQTDYLEEPETGWNMAESEAYLQSWCSDLCTTELEAYQHLKALQGKQIPKVFTSVTLYAQGQQPTPPAEAAKFLQTPGILMEHIVGDTLVQMPDFVHRQNWQAIFDNALKVLRVVSDQGVINERISPTNFVASTQSGNNGEPRVTMVDFSQCMIRQNGQSDDAWKRLQAIQDEEGNFARAMTTILRRVDFDLRYTPSNLRVTL